MTQKYKATGIILKGSSLKESDRLVTVLSPEYGLIRAVAPGAKKHKSRLRGRTELFVVNELLLIKGRSLDKIIQADTLYTYPGLSRELGKLASAQYLGELALCLAVDGQPQTELYEIFTEHLRRIENFAIHESSVLYPSGISFGDAPRTSVCSRSETFAPQLSHRETTEPGMTSSIYPYLAQAIFHLLAIAGFTPQVFNCCLTQRQIIPDLASPQWRVGFSFEAGGIINLAASKTQPQLTRIKNQANLDPHSEEHDYNPLLKINYRLNASELKILQQLNRQTLPSKVLLTEDKEETASLDFDTAWIRIERILREYIQYHIGKTIRSATLVDNLYIEF